MVKRLLLLLSCMLSASACEAGRLDQQEPLEYLVGFHAAVSNGELIATIKLEQATHVAKSFDFAAPEGRYMVLAHTGEVTHRKGRLKWSPDAHGGTLKYRYTVDEDRGSGFDARLSEKGLLARLDDVFPRATVRTEKGARSKSTLSMESDQDWSFETPYGNLKEPIQVPNQGRNFTRPMGWFLGGNLATRREVILDRQIAVSTLPGDGARQMDMLTFLQWTFPQVVEVMPNFPERLLIAVGGDGMWRGALSAPRSLYLQKDRPLVSANGTSTLLHELFHVGGLHSAAEGDDWIVEGLAEYYSLLTLKRSGGLSDVRFDTALSKLEDWAERDAGQLTSPSKGADTAYAVLIFHRLDKELSAEGRQLDQVVQALIESEEQISLASLRDICDSLLGRRSLILEGLDQT